MAKRKVLTEQEKKQKYAKQKALMEQKRDYLLQKGIPRNKVKQKYLRWSWTKIKEYASGDLIYECKQHIYIGWCDKSENADAREISGMFSGWKNEELKRYIEEILTLFGGDDSTGRPGDIRVIYGPEKAVRFMAEYNESKDYEVLVISDRFTLQGILQIVAFCLANSTEENRIHIYSSVKNYLRKNNIDLYNLFI